LLVFLVAVSVPLGWFAMQLQKARKQREAVEEIVKLGGKVGYDYHRKSNFGILLGLSIPPPQPNTPAWLRKLLGDDFFCEVVRVSCQFTEFGDNDAIHLRGLTKLECLWLDLTHSTDRGLAHLRALTDLQTLSLVGTPITDDGLQLLTRLSNLETLDLRHTGVGDDGLAHLVTLPKLKMLHLNGTEITDDGLRQLERLKKLKFIELDGTQVSGEGVKALRRALPDCVIGAL
jgi:hypothetical protein